MSSPDEVERQIDRTRVEIAQTLDALEHKLTARHFLEKGIDMFNNDMNGNEVLNRGMEMIRANPVPVALIGLGAAWLIANNTSVVDRLAQDERVRRVSDMASDLGNRAGELASGVAEKVGFGGSDTGGRALGHTGHPMVDENSDRSGDGWVHQVSGMAQGALRSARDSGGAILNRAGDYAGGGAGQIAGQLSEAFEQHPLLIGAIGVMAGALIASLLPATRVEDELLGGARDELWHKAEEAGQQAVRAAWRGVSEKVVDVAADAAKDGIRAGADRFNG